MILKTLVLNLGGLNTDWIQIEVASLLSASDLIVKKIAYLCKNNLKQGLCVKTAFSAKLFIFTMTGSAI